MHSYLRFLLLALVCCLAVSSAMADDNKEFEKRVYQRTSELLHGHTYDEANLVVADSIYKESKERGSLIGMVSADRLRMYVYVAIPDSDKLMEAADEALSLCRQLDDVEGYVEAMNVKVSFLIGREHFFTARQLTEEMLRNSNDSPEVLAQCYTLMGNIFQNRNMQESAIPYYEKALTYINEEDSIKLCLTYRDLSECHSLMSNHEQALDYAHKALSVAGDEGVYYIWSAFTYLYVLFEMGDYDTFLKEYNRIRLFEQPIDGVLVAHARNQLLLRYELVRGNYAEALKLAEGIEFKMLRLPAMAMVYRMSGNWKKAYEYLKMFNDFEDSVRNQTAMDAMLEADAQIGMDHLKMEKRDLEVRNQRVLMGSFIVFILLCMVMLGIMLVRRRVHIRQLNAKNEELREINQQLNVKNDELVLARDEAERSSQMKTHFIQNISHEVRTPLHAISGFSELLTKDITPEEQQQYTQIIVDNIGNMTTMLDDTILLSDLDGGTYRLNLRKIAAVEPQRMVAKWAEGVMREGLKWECPIDLDDHVCLQVDANLLFTILCKLIGNAVKFTQSGSITLGCQLTDDAQVRYTVTDTGCGIPAAWTERVFERFAKVDEYVPGVGIGLPICREAAELMGGSIWLDTQYVNGARFVVQFPCMS